MYFNHSLTNKIEECFLDVKTGLAVELKKGMNNFIPSSHQIHKNIIL